MRTEIVPEGWKAHTLAGWVSVKLRLPKSSCTVLVWDDLEMFQATFFVGPRTLPYFYSASRGHLPEVTHWQELPQKPEPT
jgi:hypothetical protein